MPFVVLLFLLGVAYAFFFAAPRALTFLSGFMSDLFEWRPDGSSVITFFLTLMLGLGLAFQLPVVMFILAKLGVGARRRCAPSANTPFLSSHTVRGDHAVDRTVQYGGRLRTALSAL